MGHSLIRSGALVLGAVLFMALNTSCSGSENALTPTPAETRTISNDSNVTYATSGVRVLAAPDSFADGDSLALGVVLNPGDLPAQARNPAIHAKVSSVVLVDSADSGVAIQTPLNVRIPLINRDELDNNTSLRLFMFNELAGRWVATGRNASIADDTRTANFTVDALGTYGLFRAVPLRVSIDPTRTVGKAPFSVGLNAVLKGGTPPYSVIWYFGDDSDPEVGEAVSHLYKDPFTYNATCTVTDAAGEVATAFVDLRAF